MKKTQIVETIAILLILLFTYAAAIKILEFGRFISQIKESPILAGIAWWLALLIPAIELLISIMLIIPTKRLLGFLIATTVMFLFTIYISLILTISDRIPCSCGGILGQMGWKSHLVFNIVFTGLAITGWKLQKKLQKQQYNETINSSLEYS